jgi:hypothetical protein
MALITVTKHLPSECFNIEDLNIKLKMYIFVKVGYKSNSKLDSRINKYLMNSSH